MQLPLYQVDAFASRIFTGNPAAVCPLAEWLDPGVMQAIAAENNLSETAFLVAEGDGYGLRWFTPAKEVPLCGHATLASGWVVMNRLQPARDEVEFRTASGPLKVARDGDRLSLDLPRQPPQPAAAPPALVHGLGVEPATVLAGAMWLAVYDDPAVVAGLQPDQTVLATLDLAEVCVTAPGRGDCDFVSRFFAPGIGIPEDPVTGAAHCLLVPYWAERLGRRTLAARQVSPRGGELVCLDRGDRIRLGGRCALYLEGTIHV